MYNGSVSTRGCKMWVSRVWELIGGPMTFWYYWSDRDIEFIDFDRQYKSGLCACFGSILVSDLVIYSVGAMKEINNK